jgi:uncharacterized membrane protein
VTLHPISPRFPNAIALLLATLGLVGPFARPAAAADWTVEPAANQFGAGRENFQYTLNPGGQVEDGVVVVNHGATPLRLALQATDAGEWVSLDRDDVTVPPGKSAEVPFVLALPSDASPGDHVGDIVTSNAGQRVGVPIRLRVGGALKPNLSVENVGVHYSDGDATVTYTVHNTGNAILSARQRVSVSGPFGRWTVAAGSIPDTAPLLPGKNLKVSAPLHDVTPALRLTATVTLVPLLTDAAGSTAPLAATKTSGSAWTVPWALLIAVLVVGGLVAAGLVLRPRRRLRASRTTV